MTKAATKVELWPVEKIHPYEKNAKKHPQKQIDTLAEMIRAHGFDQPIVVDGDGVIIKGHGRLLAAKKLELKKVPVVVRGDLTPAQVREARIADNRVAEMGAWDTDVLLADIKDAMNLDDFNLELLGLKSSFITEHLRVSDEVMDDLVRTELRYSVIVDFASEDEQGAFLEEQEEKGHKCRLLIS